MYALEQQPINERQLPRELQRVNVLFQGLETFRCFDLPYANQLDTSLPGRFYVTS
jgi:hypothetical protein